ncbi:hypothetical protein PCANC_00187 [Puccinia coronata f. sp. avenae]|uniref:3-hydroxyisobutyryl-CoA hydrolase n=1 Tax=Puccinia coronata f. sp. avenae TaxID=200324 RepID=A0A2N5W8G9_9BASI|nr:hypothetical protein PCANC_00187 [Puccinia coronata f. sp. avenae]
MSRLAISRNPLARTLARGTTHSPPAPFSTPLRRASLSPTPGTMSARPSASHRRLAMLDHHLRRVSSQPYSSKPPSDPKMPSVLTKTDANLRTLTLNRPEALNALNIDMIHSITAELTKWENSEAAKLIILKGTGRAFCAGGDVVSLVKAAESEDAAKQKESVGFFRSEYVLDSFIAKMSTPVVCFLDGITMGGGMGLSMHTPFRIATENTRVAMPETAIGLFPDVGATFFLPRLDGELGTYLGLTGTSVFGWGAFQAGIATHYVPSDSLAALEERLSALSADATHDRISDAINEFAADANEARDSSRPWDLKGAKRQAIDHCFAQNTVEKIVAQLKAVQDGHLFSEDPSLKAWAGETLDLIQIRSPSSCIITLMALREGKKLSIDECFAMDMRLAASCCDTKTHPDFVTGVKHLLINKQKSRPGWSPSALAEVDVAEVRKKYFSRDAAPTTHMVKLDYLPTRMKAYHEYPHAQYGLPSEESIKSFVIGNVKGASGHLAITKDELLSLVSLKWTAKVGLLEKLDDVLLRRTTQKGPNEGSVLKWQY